MPASEPKVALWEDFVLRLIAIYKLLHGSFFAALGFGLLKLRHHDVVEVVNDVIDHYHLNPENQLVDWILAKAGTVSPHMLVLAGWGFFFYAALFFAEGIGLYLRKRWAEYMVVIVTGSLLPLEIYELCVKLAWWKCAVLAGNLAVVGYLIHRLVLDSHNRAQMKKNAQSSDTAPPPSAAAKPIPTEVG